MFRTELQDRPTLWVVRRLLDAVKQAEDRLAPMALDKPWAYLTKSRGATWEERAIEYEAELLARYEGLLKEYLDLKGIRSKRDVQDAIDNVHQAFVEIYTLADARRFSPMLWEFVVGTGFSWSPQSKRKFMLRQFVEDIPKGQSRNWLKWLAFEHVRGAPPPTPGDLALVRGAYPALHRAMLEHGAGLGQMTDGSITAEILSKFKAPFGQYDDWLFEE